MLKIAVDVGVYETGRKKPEYTLQTDLNGEISLLDFLEFTKSALIATADTVLKEEQAMGFDKDPVIIVDGSVGKRVTDVGPLGKIEIKARAYLKDLILDTYNMLLNKSPVWTGRYKSSHYVFLNGQQVATDLPSLTTWLNGDPQINDNDVVRFVDIQPYARKLERMGVTEQRTKTRTVTSKRKDKTRTRMFQPNGVYFLTARAISTKYKNNAKIKFTFIPGSQLGLAASFKKSRRGKPGRTYLYPSIVIGISGAGVY